MSLTRRRFLGRVAPLGVLTLFPACGKDESSDRALPAVEEARGHLHDPFASGAVGPDADPYAWLKHFGSRVPEVQLQQTDGLADRHWPFTAEHNAGGRVDPGRVLDILADAGAQDVLLILEVIPAFEADDRQVIEDLRVSAEAWRAALAERGLRC